MMPVYIAMLRGINVGGHKKIKMDDLRLSFEKAGFEQVKTYIQSGNVVFAAKKSSSQALREKIEKQVLSDFGFPVSVIVRTAGELNTAINCNPFLKERGMDLTKLHVTFLHEVLNPATVKKFDALVSRPHRAHCAGREIYWHLPNGVAESPLMKGNVDRVLAVPITTRNWKTANALLQMCRDCE